MAYAAMKADELPRRTRQKLSPTKFERTPEWVALRGDIVRGLRPYEVLQVTLTEEDREKYGIRNHRTLEKFVRKYLAEHGIDLVVKSGQRDGVAYLRVSSFSLGK